MSNESEHQSVSIRAMTPTIEKIASAPASVEATSFTASDVALLLGEASAKAPPGARRLLSSIAAAMTGSKESFTVYTLETGGSLMANCSAVSVSHLVVSGSAKIESGPDAPPLRELLPGDHAGPHAVLVSTSDETKIASLPTEIVVGRSIGRHTPPDRPISLSSREVSRAVLDQALDALIRERCTALVTERRGIASILNPWKQTYVDRAGERAVTLAEQHAIQLRAVELLTKHGSSEHEIRELALACRKEAFLSAAISRDLTEALHDCEAQIVRLEGRRSTNGGSALYGASLDRDFRERAGAIAEARKELESSMASLLKRRDKEIGVGKRELLVQTAHELFVARAERAAALTTLASRIASELGDGAPEERRAEALAERFLTLGRIVTREAPERLLEAALNFSALLDHGLSPAELRTTAERLLRIRWLERAGIRVGADRSAGPERRAADLQDDLFGLLRLATDRAQLGIQMDARLDESLAEARETEEDPESLRERLLGGETPVSILPASRESILTERLLPPDSPSHIALEQLRADLRAGRRSDHPEYALGLFSRSLLDCLAEGRLHCLLFAGPSSAAMELALARYGAPRERSSILPVPRLDGGACGALMSFPSGRQVLVLPCDDTDDMLHLGAALLSHESGGSRIPRDRLELAGLPSSLGCNFTREIESLFYEDFRARAVTGLMDLNEQLSVFGRKLHHEIVPTQLAYLDDPERDLSAIFGEDLEKGASADRLSIYYVRDKETGSITRLLVQAARSPICGLAAARLAESFLDAEIGHKNPNVVIHFASRLRAVGASPPPREGQLFASLCSSPAEEDNLASRLDAHADVTCLRASLRASPLLTDSEGKDLALIDHVSRGVRALANRHNADNGGLVKRFGPMTVTTLVTHRRDAGWGVCAPRIAGSPFAWLGAELSPVAIKALRSLFSISCREYRKHFSSHDFKQ